MSAPQPQTLLFDTEKSAESYVHLYQFEQGMPPGQALWPAPIPVIGVSGKIGQGKTTFLLDIAGGPVKRIDVPAEMLKLHPNGYRPMDTFAWFHTVVKSIPVGMFRVIALDVAEEIEQGLAEWVYENPLHFNTNRQQFLKMPAIYQGLVSSFWKSILMDLTSRCDTFAFSNHTGLVFDSSGKPVPGKEKSKGRPVMKQSASLYINLTRDKDAAGNLKEIPAGVIDLSEGGKSRLMTWAVRDGVRVKVPVLPPRMPVATPAAIREYFRNPPDYRNLGVQQRSPEKVMTEADRAAMRLDIARQEAETERLRIERLAEERRAGRNEDGVAVQFEEPAGHGAAEEPAATTAVAPVPATPAEVAQVAPVPSTCQLDAQPPARPAVSKNILDYLAGKPAAVPYGTLESEMWRIAALDSAQVHDAFKRLVKAGKIEAKAVGETMYVGMPGMALPEETLAVPAAPTPAVAHASAAPAAPIAAPAPAAPASAPPAYQRPACLAPTLNASVIALWEEFAHISGWSQADKDLAWSTAVLDRYGCITGKELTDANLAEIEQQLVRNIHNAYIERGTPLASPFRAEFGDRLAS